jgi:Fibronectin type III domain/Putative Ig domain
MRCHRNLALPWLVAFFAACVGTSGSGSSSDAGRGATVPGAPTNVVAVAGDQTASLSWAAPIDSGGSPVTAYSIAINPASSAAQVAISGTTAAVTALTNGTAYTFTVAAVNAAGTGPESLPSSAVTPMAAAPGTPTAPRAVTATAGIRSATLSWTMPSSDGGSSVTGYNVTTYPPTPSAVVTVSGTTASVTGLSNGATYTFSVAAYNAIGMGPAALSAPVTTFNVPGAPTNVVAVAGNQSASLTWTAPGNTGGSPVSSYIIASPQIAPVQATFTGGTAATVTSLTNATPYTFTVSAVNAVGTGPASAASAPVTPAPPSAPPSGLTYAANPAIYNLGSPIPPNAPSSTGGAIASYSVLPTLPAGLSLSPLTGVLSGTPTAIAAAATYTVTATNSLGSTTVGLSITVIAASPTLAQRRAFGAIAPGRGLSPATNYTIRFQNQVGAGNCIVLVLDYSNGITVSSITDDATNTWSATPAVSANAGSGRNKTEAYVLQNSNAGARNFTITFSAAENNVHFILLEYYNVATTGAVGVTASSTTARAPTISTSAIAPTEGSLVLHYSMDNSALIGEGVAVTSFTAGTGWTLEAADYASGNSGGPVDMSFFVLQTRIASGGSVTPTVTTTGTTTVNSIALELKAASAGTPPPTGIRVLRMQDYLNSNIDVATWSEPFPCSGNLLAVFESNGDITSVISDSNSNTWAIPVRGVNSDVCSLNYAKNPITNSTLVMHWPITGTGQNTTVTAYDITGADTVSPYVQSVTTGPSAVNGHFTGQPIITPQRENGVVIVVMGDGIGPTTELTQPAGAFYLSASYPGEVDNDTINNADGYAIYYYGTDLSTQNYGWYIPTGGDSANATAVEFAVP